MKRNGRRTRPWKLIAATIVTVALLAMVSGCPDGSLLDLVGGSDDPNGTNGGTHTVGDTGPAGGIVFYDKGSYSDGWRYLEAAPASTEWTNKPWGGFGTQVAMTGTDVGTGEANTLAIVTQYGGEEPFENRADYAAKLCADLEYGGKTDWFLPSKEELNLMYWNLHVEGLGGFASANYWSSSEDVATSAWRHAFDNGSQYGDLKDFSSRVRAARAF